MGSLESGLRVGKGGNILRDLGGGHGWVGVGWGRGLRLKEYNDNK